MQNLFKNLKIDLLEKKIMAFLEKNLLVLLISSISYVLLVMFSPVFSLLWLCIPTLYFLYVCNYNFILKIWGFTIGIWYLIFSTSLSNITILIGFENTEVVINYLLDNTFFFESLCFQTVYLLDALSAKLGFSIYVPAVINIFGVISKFFDNNTECSSEKDSTAKKNNSFPFPSFFSREVEKSQSEVDMSKCASLAKEIEKTSSLFHSSTATTDGKRTVTYSKTWVPGLGIQNNCHARAASSLEKDLFEQNKKK